ncbi:MAG: hypothetical protein WCJ30_12970 [Deltaproteobacteria bacterium]
MRERRLVALSAGGTAVFVASFGAAIARYPGGTWFNRHAHGHSLAKNFLCDLLQTRALNGQDARVGAQLAGLGMFAMLVALAAFFALVAGLETPVSRAGRIARGAGLLACILGAAIPLTPSDRFRTAHLAAVLVGFVPALLATVAALVVCLRAPGVSRWTRALALLTVSSGALNGFAYAYAAAARTHLVDHALPVLQRVSTFGVIGWVLAVCVHVASDRTPAD